VSRKKNRKKSAGLNNQMESGSAIYRERREVDIGSIAIDTDTNTRVDE